MRLTEINLQSQDHILPFNKPKGWTSFDLVKKVRNLTRFKKVGHAGTLDPLATGLLILCTGKETKGIDSIQAMEKEYVTVFKLGAVTASYDAEFPEEQIKDTSRLTEEAIADAMRAFSGPIQQVPPAFSAVKVKGKRAYEAARKGESLALEARTVHIYGFELLDASHLPLVTARIACSKGTYIRSLVHDLGQNLGLGAYICDLKRTRIGTYSLDEAWEIDEFVSLIQEQKKDPGYHPRA